MLKLALATAIIGTVLLLFLSQNLEPKAVKISDISEKNIDSFVKIQGKAISVNPGDDYLRLKVSDETDSITVLAWNTFYSENNVSKNDVLEITGKVTEYKGVLEISAEKISKIYN